MTYVQITLEERYAISALRKLGSSSSAIARALGRHRSTISREVRRNAWREDGRTCRAFKCASTPKLPQLRNTQIPAPGFSWS